MSEPLLEVENPYETIKIWWGQPLDKELIDRITRAPERQLRQFLEEALRNQIVVSSTLPILVSGELRPLVLETGDDRIAHNDRFRYIDSAMPLLLYAHKAILEDPFRYAIADDKASVHRLFARLLAVKPLAESGDLQFVRAAEKERHPSRNSLPLDKASFAVLEEAFTRTGGVERYSRNLQFSIMNYFRLSLRMVQMHPGQLHALARNALEDALMQVTISGGMSGAGDARQLHLSKIAAFTVPEIRTDAATIVAVRRSDEDFADWRFALTNALTAIQEIPETVNWHREAADIVHTELAPLRERVRGAAEKSAVLRAAKSSLTSFTFSGVGALAGAAAGGNLATSLAGTGAGKGAEFVQSYLNAVREKRRAKAVLDLTLAFHRNDG